MGRRSLVLALAVLLALPLAPARAAPPGQVHVVLYALPPADTLTSDASADTFIRQESATTNFSTSDKLYIGEYNGGAELDRALLQFDLSAIPAGATINSASLSLYAIEDWSSNARTVRVYRVKRAWVGSEATWNVYSTGNSWQTAGGFGANDAEQTDIGSLALGAAETLNEYKVWSLTASAVEEMISGGTWTDHGFLVKVDTESDDLYGYASTEDSDSSHRPKLELDYTPATPTPTPGPSPTPGSTPEPALALAQSSSQPPDAHNFWYWLLTGALSFIQTMAARLPPYVPVGLAPLVYNLLIGALAPIVFFVGSFINLCWFFVIMGIILAAEIARGLIALYRQLVKLLPLP